MRASSSVLIRTKRLLDREKRIVERAEKPGRLLGAVPEVIRVNPDPEALRGPAAKHLDVLPIAFEVAGQLQLEIREPILAVPLSGGAERIGVCIADHGRVQEATALQAWQRRGSPPSSGAVLCQDVENRQLDRTPGRRVSVEIVLRVRVIQAASEARSTTSSRNPASCREKNAAAVSSVSPVT